MLNRSRLRLLFVAILLSLPGLGLGQSKPSNRAKSAPPQPGDEFVVPSTTQIPLALTSAVSTRTAYVGQPVYGQTLYPVDINNRIVIPVGTYVKGTVTEVERAGHIHRRSTMGLRFDSMILPSGFTKLFAGTLAGFAGNGKEGFNRTESRIEGAGDKGKDAEKVVISSAEGAGLGAIVGISGGRSGAGAAAGATGGAILGTVFVLASRGKDILLPAGTDLELELTRPLVLYRYQVDPPANAPSGPTFPKRDPGPGM
ncbi:MAG TPA: hypothetical protein VMI06_03545 [Terriglobia bacterium]|nr:hypothetical protein [Terriglobia bacterium]